MRACLDRPVGGAGEEEAGVEGVPPHRVHRHVVPAAHAAHVVAAAGGGGGGDTVCLEVLFCGDVVVVDLCVDGGGGGSERGVRVSMGIGALFNI